jgi:hypothetical protein
MAVVLGARLDKGLASSLQDGGFDVRATVVDGSNGAKSLGFDELPLLRVKEGVYTFEMLRLNLSEVRQASASRSLDLIWVRSC